MSDTFRVELEALGVKCNVSDELFTIIGHFTCPIYARCAKSTAISALRYETSCSKNGDVSSGQLPPYKDALKQHSKRANHQAAIWRRSLKNSPEVPEVTYGYGWVTEGDRQIEIEWISGEPARHIVCLLMSSKCMRSCKAGICQYTDNGLPCTQVCKLLDCDNMLKDDVNLHKTPDMDDISDIDEY